MPKKTKEEIKAWVEDKKTKKGDRIVVEDENVASSSTPHIKKEVAKL